MHGIVGEPGAMRDACMHLPFMTFICNNNYNTQAIKCMCAYIATILRGLITIKKQKNNALSYMNRSMVSLYW